MQKLKELIKNESALKCALELNRAGFIISIDANHTDYFHFSNGKKVGYIQFETYGAFSVSVQYLSTNCGTGANFLDRSYDLPINYKNFVDMANALFNYNQLVLHYIVICTSLFYVQMIGNVSLESLFEFIAILLAFIVVLGLLINGVDQ